MGIAGDKLCLDWLIFNSTLLHLHYYNIYTTTSIRQYLHYNIYTLHNRCQHRRGPCHPNPCRHGGQCHYSAEVGVTCLKKNISQKNIFSQNILKKMFSRIFRKNIPPKKLIYFWKKLMVKPPCCPQGQGWYRAIARSQPSWWILSEP